MAGKLLRVHRLIFKPGSYLTHVQDPRILMICLRGFRSTLDACTAGLLQCNYTSISFTFPACKFLTWSQNFIPYFTGGCQNSWCCFPPFLPAAFWIVDPSICNITLFADRSGLLSSLVKTIYHYPDRGCDPILWFGVCWFCSECDNLFFWVYSSSWQRPRKRHGIYTIVVDPFWKKKSIPVHPWPQTLLCCVHTFYCRTIRNFM